METKKITIQYFDTAEGHSPFEEWFNSLKNNETANRILARLARVRDGNLGDHRDLGGGIFEMRLFLGPGYRIYFAKKGDSIIILLFAGDKDSQKKDIAKARKLYEQYMEK